MACHTSLCFSVTISVWLRFYWSYQAGVGLAPGSGGAQGCSRGLILGPSAKETWLTSWCWVTGAQRTSHHKSTFKTLAAIVPAHVPLAGARQGRSHNQWGRRGCCAPRGGSHLLNRSALSCSLTARTPGSRPSSSFLAPWFSKSCLTQSREPRPSPVAIVSSYPDQNSGTNRDHYWSHNSGVWYSHIHNDLGKHVF